MGEPGLVDEIDHAFLIAHFGGTVVDAFAYSDDLAGFQMYLDDVGVPGRLVDVEVDLDHEVEVLESAAQSGAVRR